MASHSDYSVKPVNTARLTNLKNILLVGNSFMFYNCGVNGMMNGFAKSLSRPMVLTMVTIGGASLYWHDVKSYLAPNRIRSYSISSDGENRVEFIDYPNGRVFDAVVLEDSSQSPIHPQLKELFRESAAKHCRDIRETGAVPYFMMTWAYKGKPEMTQTLADVIIEVANENNASVIPVGLAFAKSLRDCPSIELIRSDNRHPTVAGTYLEAAVFFSALSGISVEDSSFCGRFDDLVLPEKVALKLRTIAWETVRDFNGWH